LHFLDLGEFNDNMKSPAILKIKIFVVTIIMSFASMPLFSKLYDVIINPRGGGWWGPKPEDLAGFSIAFLLFVSLFINIFSARDKRIKRTIIFLVSYIVLYIVSVGFYYDDWLFILVSVISGWGIISIASWIGNQYKSVLKNTKKNLALYLRLGLMIFFSFMILAGWLPEVILNSSTRGLLEFFKPFAIYYWIFVSVVSIFIMLFSVVFENSKRFIYFGIVLFLVLLFNILFGATELIIRNLFILIFLWILSDLIFEIQKIVFLRLKRI